MRKARSGRHPLRDLTAALRKRARRAGDDGITLVETLVTMAVFSIAVVVVFQALITVQRQTGDLESTANAVSQTRLALAQIDKQVRSGNVLYSPADEPVGLPSCTAPVGTTSGTCMRVYTQTNGPQKCVQWQLLEEVAGSGVAILRSRSWTLDLTTVSGWGTVARGLNYTTTPFTLQGGTTIYKSRLLDVRLEALDPRRAAPPVVIDSSLSGRNTNYGYDVGLCSPVPAP